MDDGKQDFTMGRRMGRDWSPTWRNKVSAWRRLTSKISSRGIREVTRLVARHVVQQSVTGTLFPSL